MRITETRVREEPNPAGGANLDTFYTYNVLNKLKTVSMTRSGTAQTRPFVYNANQQLQNATHPESGTTPHTYNSDGTVATRTDAKNQQMQYSYDTYPRVTGSISPSSRMMTLKSGIWRSRESERTRITTTGRPA